MAELLPRFEPLQSPLFENLKIEEGSVGWWEELSVGMSTSPGESPESRLSGPVDCFQTSCSSLRAPLKLDALMKLRGAGGRQASAEVQQLSPDIGTM